MSMSPLLPAQPVRYGKREQEKLEDMVFRILSGIETDRGSNMEVDMLEELYPWKKQNKRKGIISRKPHGYRDVMWCPYINEPAIIEYRDGKPYCPLCNGNFEASTHEFICHIKK